MAIAAGESSNAVANIAKGVMATIDNFTSDDKERRAYKRQAGLSAGKYALEAMQRAETKADALAKEGRVQKTFIVASPFKSKGVQYGPGKIFITDSATIRTDDFAKNILPHLTTEGVWKGVLDNQAATAKLLNPQMIGSGKGAPTFKDLQTSLKDYSTYTDEARNSAKMMTMIDASILTNAAGQATGFATWASVKLNQLKNSLRMKKELSILKNIGSEEGESTEVYRFQQQVIANMMLKEILGEGSKNISNVDRQLAQQIAGLMSQWDSIFADPDVLNARLQNIRNVVYNGFKSRLRNMRGVEFAWRNTINRAQQPVSSELRSMREEFLADLSRLPGVVKGVVARETAKDEAVEPLAFPSSFTRGPRGPEPLRLADFYDFKTRKLKKKLPI